MNPTRRNLIRSATMIPIGLVLADCAALSSIPNVTAQVVSDINVIADGVAAILPGLSAVGSVGAAIASAVGALVSDAKGAASAVSTAITTVAAQPFVSTVAADITAAITAVKSITLPSGITNILSAAQSLLPFVQQAVGLGQTLISAIPLAGPAMSPDAARAILAAAASGRMS